MKKIVKQLIDLQKIDSKFDVLQLQKGDLPFMIDETENDLEMKIANKDELEENKDKNRK